jgi:hypothetical protein
MWVSAHHPPSPRRRELGGLTNQMAYSTSERVVFVGGVGILSGVVEVLLGRAGEFLVSF